jgi:hypothetical protein
MEGRRLNIIEKGKERSEMFREGKSSIGSVDAVLAWLPTGAGYLVEKLSRHLWNKKGFGMYDGSSPEQRHILPQRIRCRLR